MELGLHIVGGSACALRPWLMTPFDNARHGTPEDAFNFHHSSNRIYAEYAFRKIDARWGILLSPLRFSLKHNLILIDAAMRLHNFTAKHEMKCNKRLSQSNEFDRDILEFMQGNPKKIVGIFATIFKVIKVEAPMLICS